MASLGQRLVTLVYSDMEAVRTLPNTFADLEALARDWVNPPLDANLLLRIPIEFASPHAARFISGSHIWLTSEDSYQITILGVQGSRVEIYSNTPPPPDEPPPRPPWTDILALPPTRPSWAVISDRASRHGPDTIAYRRLETVLNRFRHLNLDGKIDYDNRNLLNSGGFSDLFVGHPRENALGEAEKVAVKRIRVHTSSTSDHFWTRIAREIYIWSKLNHPNVLPLLGYMHDGAYLCLVSTWVDNGTLKHYLEWVPHDEYKTEALLKIISVAKGLKYLHDCYVIHSDIKADNILVSAVGEPMLCDFGLSRMLTATQTFATSTQKAASGTIRWMAVELLDEGDEVSDEERDHYGVFESEAWAFGKSIAPELFQEEVDHIGEGNNSAVHSKESDIWAFGMTIYEVMEKQVPYAHLRNDPQVLNAILRCREPFPHGRQPRYNPPLWDLCRKCWEKDPRMRPTIDGVIASLVECLSSASAT